VDVLWVLGDPAQLVPAESIRRAGVDVIVLGRDEASKVRRPMGSLLSRLPLVAHRDNTTTMRLALAEAIDGQWDVVVLDGLGAGWALAMLRGYVTRNASTRLVHVVRPIEATAFANPVARRIDARKVRSLERSLAEVGDVVFGDDPDLAMRLLS
jgi:hypothetical protein